MAPAYEAEYSHSHERLLVNTATGCANNADEDSIARRTSVLDAGHLQKLWIVQSVTLCSTIVALTVYSIVFEPSIR